MVPQSFVRLLQQGFVWGHMLSSMANRLWRSTVIIQVTNVNLCQAWRCQSS